MFTTYLRYCLIVLTCCCFSCACILQSCWESKSRTETIVSAYGLWSSRQILPTPGSQQKTVPTWPRQGEPIVEIRCHLAGLTAMLAFVTCTSVILWLQCAEHCSPQKLTMQGSRLLSNIAIRCRRIMSSLTSMKEVFYLSWMLTPLSCTLWFGRLLQERFLRSQLHYKLMLVCLVSS